MNFSVLLKYVTPHRLTLFGVMLVLLAGSALSLVQPWLAGQLTALVLDAGDALWSMSQVLAAWITLLVARSTVSFSSQYYIGSTGELMAAQLRTRLYQHMQALPLGYFQQRRSGDVLTLLSNDAELISRFVTDTLVRLLPLLLTFIGAVAMMALIDPLIASLAVLIMPAYYFVMKVIGRRIRPISRAWIDAYSDLMNLTWENLGMLPVIKASTRERLEEERFVQHGDKLLSLSRRQLLIQSMLGPAVSLLAGLGLLLLLWLGSERIATEHISPAELVSLLLYALLMNQPLQGLADVYGRVQATRGAAERIRDFLAQAPEPTDEGLPSLPAIEGNIEFKAVDFSYPQRPPLLSNLDLSIAAGETLAITGANGTGKSTLAHLLMRFMSPDAGRICIDGRDISQFSLESLRRQIGLVSQHTLLLNSSIARNIAYGEPLASREKIEGAARRAHAHDFISALPDGYDTVIGDQGLRLSGGQRQRLALARTMLTDPPVLVFDEATAMFDPEAEKAFIQECRERLGGKTVILITHRPASLALADRIIELAQQG